MRLLTMSSFLFPCGVKGTLLSWKTQKWYLYTPIGRFTSLISSDSITYYLKFEIKFSIFFTCAHWVNSIIWFIHVLILTSYWWRDSEYEIILFETRSLYLTKSMKYCGRNFVPLSKIVWIGRLNLTNCFNFVLYWYVLVVRHSFKNKCPCFQKLGQRQIWDTGIYWGTNGIIVSLGT